MNHTFAHAYTSTPTPNTTWLQLSDEKRLAFVKNALEASKQAKFKILAILEAKQDGQIIARLLEPVPADQRGTLLLDLEAFLKESIDPGLVVWLEPLGDRSSLRNLRGIEVKS
jgi:Tfp pilus assembly ATPase PilU